MKQCLLHKDQEDDPIRIQKASTSSSLSFFTKTKVEINFIWKLFLLKSVFIASAIKINCLEILRSQKKSNFSIRESSCDVPDRHWGCLQLVRSEGNKKSKLKKSKSILY